MKEKSQRPGILLYFEFSPVFQKLGYADTGRLVLAAMRYGEYGEIPDFEKDPQLDIFWTLLRPKLDADKERYTERCEKSAYATYCRETKKQGEIPSEYEEWASSSGNK